MTNETPITIVGNLTADPTLKFFDSGKAVANFTIASTPRFLDKNTGQWTDGDALFLRCNLWGPYAENAIETLAKGMQVIATGRLKQRSYETREGDKRTIFELDIDEIGPTLRFAIAKVIKATRTGGQGQTGGQNGSAVQRSTGAGRDDASAESGWGAGYSDEPPF